MQIAGDFLLFLTIEYLPCLCIQRSAQHRSAHLIRLSTGPGRPARWAVAGREHCKSFAAKPLADGFVAELKNAIGDHLPFDENTGLPPAAGHAAASRSWYDHARAYTEMKWPHLAAGTR